MQKNKHIWKLSFLLLALVYVAYAKHFDNEFHFDDAHTIQNNGHIQDIKNIPNFFTQGAETFSSLPANQVYRPMVSTSIAIDFWLSEQFYPDSLGFDTRPYHWSMFATFLVLLVLIFFFVKKIFDQIVESDWNIWFALFAAAWYGLHTVNAETLNYIISRSDLISTFFVLVAFVLYQYAPKYRKFGLFFIPFILGIFTKLTAAMFIPLFVVYYAIFYFQDQLKDASTKQAKRQLIIRTLLQALVPFVLFVGGVYFIISQQSESFNPGGASRLEYMVTQTFVMFHYFVSFFVPYHLSADTDWTIIPMNDVRFFVGISFILAMLFVVYKTAFKKHLRPIAFGILWFFIALAPTSSIIPLAEVMNDHRMMFPFIGLLISTVWSLKLVFEKYKERIMSSFAVKNVLVLAIATLLGAHLYGTMKRVEVWDNGESLWYDVTVKSPKNGRGLMNYGLRLMSKADYEGAMEYFNRALEYSPNYNYLFTNIGICQNAMGNAEEGEKNLKKAIELAPYHHKGYYYYGRFLKEKDRLDEALYNFKTGMQLAPQYLYSRYAIMEIYMMQSKWNELMEITNESYQMFPKNSSIKYYYDLAMSKQSDLNISDFSKIEDVSRLIQLSLEYYNQKDFEKMVNVCQRALEIEPEKVAALNNLCTAYNELGNYAEAIEAGRKAVALDPSNQLAKNNLKLAEFRANLKAKMYTLNTTKDLINISLQYYNERMYRECVEASQLAIKIDPTSKIAYNNICSAYNVLWQLRLAKRPWILILILSGLQTI
jgi:tetratricopeptide (TPR) repeat protein